MRYTVKLSRLLLGVAVFALFVLLLGRAIDAEARLVAKSGPQMSRTQIHNRQSKNLHHARYVCENGAGKTRRWHCRAANGWLLREWKETRPQPTTTASYWITRQILAAERIGQGGDAGGTDPWPNCPDPYDHAGHSWYDTVQCENGGNWYDSPGFYRCGLQFDPMWERVYGRLCP